MAAAASGTEVFSLSGESDLPPSQYLDTSIPAGSVKVTSNRTS
jgi:hypothetical protein